MGKKVWRERSGGAKQKSSSLLEMSLLVVPPVVQSTVVSQEFGMLQALASHYLAGKTLTAPVLMSLAAALSAEVNSLRNLSGAEKKQVVCNIVLQTLETALTVSKVGVGSPAVSAEEEVALIYVAKNVIPASVDLLISAANGQLNLKKLAKTGWADCMSCLPAVGQKLRGPAWDVAEKFAKAVETSVSAGGSVKDVVAAGVAAAEAAVVVEVKEVVAEVAAAAVVVPVAAVAPVPAVPAATTTPSS
jgi:hypothetical protein